LRDNIMTLSLKGKINYGPSIVREGLVLHLDAANTKSYPGTGTVWKDLSGLGNNGTLINGTEYSADNKGNMLFDGVNDSASFVVSDDISGNNPWTISIWANVNSTENGTGRQGWLIWQGPGGQTVNQLIAMGVTSGSIEVAHWGNDTIFTGAEVVFDGWAMYTCTFDGTSEYVYVNDLQSGGPKNTTLSITTGTWYLGSRALSSDFLNTRISVFNLYNRALSESEVKQNFEAIRGRYNI
jgi:hypothetical protein